MNVKAPKRSDFIDKDLNKQILSDIQRQNDIYFRPCDIKEYNIFDKGKKVYYPFLIGILGDGSKCVVILDNIQIYVDVRIEKETQGDLIKMLAQFDKEIVRQEYVEGYPLMFFSKQKHKYMRIYFTNTQDRKNFITKMTSNENIETITVPCRKVLKRDENNEVVESEPSVRQKCVYKFDMASDDADYIYKLAREYKFNTSDWNILPGRKYAQLQPSDKLLWKLNINIPYIFKISIDDFKPVPDIIKRKNPYMGKSKFMVMCWDIETFSPKDERKRSCSGTRGKL